MKSKCREGPVAKQSCRVRNREGYHRGKREAISNVGGGLRRTKYFIGSITERCYGTKNRFPAFERTCSNSKKEDPPITNMH